MEHVGFLFRVLVAVPLDGVQVDGDRHLHFLRPAENRFHRLNIVAVDRPQIRKPERGKKLSSTNSVRMAFFSVYSACATDAPIQGMRSSPRCTLRLAEYHPQLALSFARCLLSAPTFLVMDISLSLITTISFGFRVAAVVERFVAHAARQRAVADDRDHVMGPPPQISGACQPKRSGYPGACVAGFKAIVLAFAAFREPGKPAELAQRAKFAS